MLTHWYIWLYLLLGIVTAGVEMTFIIHKKHPRQAAFENLRMTHGTIAYLAFMFIIVIVVTTLVFPISWIGWATFSHQRKLGITPPPPPPYSGYSPPPPPYPHGHPLHICRGGHPDLCQPIFQGDRLIPTLEQIKGIQAEQTRERAKEERRRFIEFHAASLQLASVRTSEGQTSSVMPPATCVVLATTLADSLGIGVTEDEKKTSELS